MHGMVSIVSSGPDTEEHDGDSHPLPGVEDLVLVALV